MQVMALRELFKIEEVRAWDIVGEAADRYAKEMSEGLGIKVNAFTEVEKVVREADIVVTVTPSREALVKKEWISEGVHINAIGADGPGKQELDPHIVAMADKVVVDSLAQCRRIGEIQHALKQGLISEDDVHAEIGHILIGEKSERESDKEITLFDSTGLAAQDIAAAYVVYKGAEEKGLGYTTKLLNT